MPLRHKISTIPSKSVNLGINQNGLKSYMKTMTHTLLIPHLKAFTLDSPQTKTKFLSVTIIISENSWGKQEIKFRKGSRKKRKGKNICRRRLRRKRPGKKENLSLNFFLSKFIFIKVPKNITIEMMIQLLIMMEFMGEIHHSV